MEFASSELEHRDLYKLLTGSIVPRAIAWVSTVDSAGQPNLAPYSFFTAVCASPPTLLFCPGIRASDLGQKDTYDNILQTGEFVINFVTEALAEAMNASSVEAPAQVNEFERAGVTAIPSRTVRAPRVQESPIHFECRLNQIVTISEGPGGGHIVIGTVQHLHFDDRIWQEGHYIDMAAYQPIGRLAGPQYSFVRDFFSMNRPPGEIPPSS